MKKLIVLAICMVGVLAAQAQGTVQFANVGGGVNNPVVDLSGAPVGAGADVWLFVGETIPGALDPAAAVGQASILANGLFSGGAVTLPGVTAGENASLFIGVTGTGGLPGCWSVQQCYRWCRQPSLNSGLYDRS
jgi:hypothetical protein